MQLDEVHAVSVEVIEKEEVLILQVGLAAVVYITTDFVFVSLMLVSCRSDGELEYFL